MTEPGTPLLEEAISSLINATTCRSCQRRPMHRASTHDSCQNNDNDSGCQNDPLESEYSSDCYNGPLMASPSCGCLFCRDCYAAASIVASHNYISDADTNGKTALLSHEKKCPVCRNPCVENPRPVITWLANQYKSLPLSIVCDSVVTTSETDSSFLKLNSLLQVLNPPIDMNEDNDKVGYSENHWIGGQNLENDQCYSFRDTHSDKIVESPPQNVNVCCETSKLNSWDGENRIQVDDSEVPGTCLSTMLKQSASEAFSIVARRRINKSERQDISFLEVEASHKEMQIAESVLPCETSKQISSKTEEIHDQNDGSQGVPGTCVQFQQCSEAFGLTEEVPGTYLSFLDRRRLPGVRNELFNSEIQDFLGGCNHIPSTLPPCSEPNGQTEEVPGTLLSFLDKRRISTVGITSSRSQMDHDEVYSSDSGAMGSLLTCDPIMKTDTKDDKKGFDQELPANSQSVFYTNNSSSPKLVKEAVLLDVADMMKLNVDSPLSSPTASQIEPNEDAHTEDVPGTILSFIDRNRMPNIEDKPPYNYSFETLHRKMSTNTKRRRVSPSPQLKLPNGKKKPNDSGNAVMSKVESQSKTYSPKMHSIGTRSRHPDNPITKQKDMIEKETCPVKKLLDAPSKSDHSSTSIIGKDTYAISIHSKLTDKKLCIAYDILDPIETNALEWLNEHGFCIVANGVHRVPSYHNSGHMPFPSILVTHAVEKPEFSTNDNKRIVSICRRTYRYVKAMALGAHIIDAKWIVDSQHAGQWLDCDPYRISSDLDTYKTCRGVSPIFIHSQILPLTGLRFSFLGYEGLIPSIDPEQGEAEPWDSQLNLRTELITTQQITDLLECWGGERSLDVITDSNNAIFIPTWKPLNSIVKDLSSSIKLIEGIKTWSIEKFHDDSKAIDQLRRSSHSHRVWSLPLIQDKWLEDSICAGSLLNLDKYCVGVVCLQTELDD